MLCPLPLEIVLRRPTIADASEALAMLTDADVTRWNPAPRVVDLKSAIDWCRRGADWSDGTHATFHAVTASDGRLLANVSIHAIEISSKTARIGYRVAPWVRRRGVGRASVDAVVRWSFAQLPITTIHLVHDLDNRASCAMAVAAGFRAGGEACGTNSRSVGNVDPEHVHERRSTESFAITWTQPTIEVASSAT